MAARCVSFAPAALLGDAPDAIDQGIFRRCIERSARSAPEEVGMILTLAGLVDFAFRGRSSAEEWETLRDLEAQIAARRETERRPRRHGTRLLGFRSGPSVGCVPSRLGTTSGGRPFPSRRSRTTSTRGSRCSRPLATRSDQAGFDRYLPDCLRPSSPAFPLSLVRGDHGALRTHPRALRRPPPASPAPGLRAGRRRCAVTRRPIQRRGDRVRRVSPPMSVATMAATPSSEASG